MDQFIARENINHYRRELENGADERTRATMLRLLVEEENHFGLTRKQLTMLDSQITRLTKIMARHVHLMAELPPDGELSERASIALATYNDLMEVYIAHRQRITVALADGGVREN